jgi:hypothetical protein
MKKIISFAIFLAFTLSSFAQMVENGQTLYGNEWINYNQTYYKFKLTTNGMHRINQTALQSAGIPVETVQAANFQIFYMGKQIPLYTTTEGVMTNSDYLEFFGKGNPFEMDKHLYANPATEHLNPNSTMFSDTSVYFLTWNNSTTNLRYNTIANDLSNLPAAETSYTNTTSFNMGANNAVSEELIFGPGINSQSSQFNAEGWGRKPDVNLTASVNLTIPNQYIVNTGGQAQVRVGIYSRDQAAHSLRIGVNGTEYDVDNFANAAYNIYNFDVPLSVLTATTSVFVKGMNGVTDKNYIAWAQITYPRSFNGNAGNAYSFILPSSNVKRYIEIPNFNHGGVAPVLYDRTNNYRIVSNLEGGIVKIALPVSASTNAIFIKAPNVFNYN